MMCYCLEVTNSYIPNKNMVRSSRQKISHQTGKRQNSSSYLRKTTLKTLKILTNKSTLSQLVDIYMTLIKMERTLDKNQTRDQADFRKSIGFYTLLWCGKKEDPSCRLNQARQTTEHVLSSCKITVSHGRYTWRHNRVLQALAVIKSTTKGRGYPT